MSRTTGQILMKIDFNIGLYNTKNNYSRVIKQTHDCETIIGVGRYETAVTGSNKKYVNKVYCLFLQI